MRKIARECDKVVKVIRSCNTLDQLDTANNMAFAFSYRHNLEDPKNEHYADIINETLEEVEEELWESGINVIGFKLG